MSSQEIAVYVIENQASEDDTYKYFGFDLYPNDDASFDFDVFTCSQYATADTARSVVEVYNLQNTVLRRVRITAQFEG